MQIRWEIIDEIVPTNVFNVDKLVALKLKRSDEKKIDEFDVSQHSICLHLRKLNIFTFFLAVVCKQRRIHFILMTNPAPNVPKKKQFSF